MPRASPEREASLLRVKRFAVLALLAVLVAWSAEAPPTAEERQRLVAEVRQAALKYTQSLPDFICTQRIQRFVKDVRGRWERLDTLTVRLSSTSQGEQYVLVEINGAPADRPYESIDGARIWGELGTLLANVFEPRAEAEFRFEKWTTVGKAPAALYSYRVPREKARYELQFLEAKSGKTLRERVGQRGEVVIDRASHAVLRITAVAEDVPDSFPLRSSSLTVTYGYTDVGGRRYLLPLESESEGSTRYQASRNVTQFRDYRKFTADSTITFGPEPPDTP